MGKTRLAYWTSVLPLLCFAAAGHCSTFKTLHQFTGGLDGANSTAELVIVGHKLYGTTVLGGGERSGGTVFSIDIATGLESVVHSFYGPLDGGNPHAGLLLWKGALYGVTAFGGAYGEGEAFKLDPTSATLTPLHSFGGGDDAAAPEGTPIEHGGVLYGTSANGGDLESGAIYGLNLNTGSEYVFFYFGDGSDGSFPTSRLLQKGGILYGTTTFGQGTLYSIDPKTGIFNLLYGFDDRFPGRGPLAGVIANGHQLLGTTAYGGGNGYKQKAHGTIFSFNPTTKQPHTLHVFHRGDHDGETAASDLLLQDGVVYGTTSEGGLYGKGTVFQLVLATKTETVLHDFTGREDGGHPVAGLIYDNGVFYGTTYDGGYSASTKGMLNYGTVFEIIP